MSEKLATSIGDKQVMKILNSLKDKNIIRYVLVLNNKYKYDIAKIIGISNINDSNIEKIVRNYGSGYDPIYITFKISVDNYNKYTLNYYDVENDKDFYEGEIINKKIKVNKYYICCYEINTLINFNPFEWEEVV